MDLAHVAIDAGSASDKPGQGQQQVVRALADNNKLRRADDHPLAPSYVRDRTPLKKGSIATADLRAEFRKDPRLPILVGDDNFVKLLRKGIDEGLYVYQSGELVRGQGRPAVPVQDRAAVLRADDGVRRGARASGRTRSRSRRSSTGGRRRHAAAPGHAAPKPRTPRRHRARACRTFRHEAPLREAVTRIVEDARAGGRREAREPAPPRLRAERRDEADERNRRGTGRRQAHRSSKASTRRLMEARPEIVVHAACRPTWRRYASSCRRSSTRRARRT